KRSNLSEAFDVREQGIGFAPRQSEQRRVHVNVLDASEFRIEAGAQFEQRCDAPLMQNFTVGWFQRPRNDLKQRRLATAVRPDEADSGAALDFEADVPQRPEFFVTSQTSARQR